MAVFVLDKRKKPLMPCSEKRARKLLQARRAVVPLEGRMKITSKGQVTIPQDVRERHGFLPGTEIRFVDDGKEVRLVKAQVRRGRGQKLVKRM